MSGIEKLIRGLKCCAAPAPGEHESCPYNDPDNPELCTTRLLNEALEALETKTIRWRPFRQDTMPPVDNDRRFLVLNGLGPEDRILLVGKRTQWGNEEPMLYLMNGQFVCHVADDQLENMLWAPVEITDEDIIEAVKHEQ